MILRILKKYSKFQIYNIKIDSLFQTKLSCPMPTQGHLLEVDGWKVYLNQKKNSRNSDCYELKIAHLNNTETYAKIFYEIEDLPEKSKIIFRSLDDFFQVFKLIAHQQSTKRKTNIIQIEPFGCIKIKLSLQIHEKFKSEHETRIKLHPMPNIPIAWNTNSMQSQIDQLQRKIKQLYNKPSMMFSNDPISKNNSSLPKKKDTPNHITLDLSDQPSKKNKKQQKKFQKGVISSPNSTQSESHNFKNLSPQTTAIVTQKSYSFGPSNNAQRQKDFIIQENKITLNQQRYRIQISLNAGHQRIKHSTIVVMIYVKNSTLIYNGQLTDVQVAQYLQQAMNYHDTKQVFEEIRKNARKKNKQTVKINQREDKLQILLTINKKGKNNKQMEAQETMFAEIDIKPIKSQPPVIHQEITKDNLRQNNKLTNSRELNNSNKKDTNLTNNKKQINNHSPKKDTGISNQIKNNKEAINSKIRDALLNQNDKRKNSKETSFDTRSQKSVSKSVKKTSPAPKNTPKQDSQISFKNKNFGQDKEKKNIKTVKNIVDSQKKLNRSCVDQQSFMHEQFSNNDLSMMLPSSNKKRSRSSKGFLLTDQFKSWEIKDKVIRLKENHISSLLCAKKIAKKLNDNQLIIKVLKITSTFIFGIAGQEAGHENLFVHPYFIGFDPITGMLYESSTAKEYRQGYVKQIKQNSAFKLKVNLKTQMISWYFKKFFSDEKQPWRLLKESIIPKFMQLKQLYPAVFLKTQDDKIEFISPK